MTKKERNLVAGGTALAVATYIIIKSRRTIPRGAVAVSPFDVEKYLGKWYEIARFDYRFENHLNNTTAEYSFNSDGSIKVINRGYNYLSHKHKIVIGKAKFTGDANEAKLKVSFFGPLYSGYNVIALDPAYEYALVAGKNLNYLWILSRGRTIPENIKEAYLEKAKQIGYDTSKLVWVSHNPS